MHYRNYVSRRDGNGEGHTWTHDKIADALCVKLAEGTVPRTDEVTDTLADDFEASGEEHRFRIYA
jgi:hypothetical protein